MVFRTKNDFLTKKMITKNGFLKICSKNKLILEQI